MKWLCAFASVVVLTACSHGESAHADVDAFPRIFEQLRPSVVLFTMKAPSDEPKKKGTYEDAYGTGFVVESGDWGSRFLTAQHVIENARHLRVTVGNRRTFAARVVAFDTKQDIAIVETREPNLRAVRLGSLSSLIPGMRIGVAGYPIPDAFADEGLGMQTSVFSGRLSSVRRDALELDAPVIPGESGGPVFNADTGEVIGIAESRFEEERAIGFAIPIADALRFLAAHPRTALSRRP
jgi:serine protease Do